MNKTAIHNIANCYTDSSCVYFIRFQANSQGILQTFKNILFPMEENGIQNLSSQRNN